MTDSIAVLQARTTSRRLPAKVLLPVGGLPLVVLAARRAANTGRRVLVATSTDPSDDELARVVRAHGLACARGSLEDTLGRFVQVLTDYADDTLVFRLTADNGLPDGRLLDDLADDLHRRDLDYLACNGAPCDLPDGFSAEVTRLRHLRAAHRGPTTPYDREHVTPAVIRARGQAWFTGYAGRGLAGQRCTIDTLDDYLAVCRLFVGYADPVGTPATRLLEALATPARDAHA
ncbi:cytidylyltransferase domain-containing protein [Alkalilimnicola ehrlichii MLHE-1]|uniref:cytidylyltransferase domain-containing protein n=1 Tax=Alkalilimnicola ehrlichii TaxID=351052 RepID=UPI0018DB73F1|nr:hypothetical protein [Alkalilimnicola ehrlichii]